MQANAAQRLVTTRGLVGNWLDVGKLDVEPTWIDGAALVVAPPLPELPPPLLNTTTSTTTTATTATPTSTGISQRFDPAVRVAKAVDPTGTGGRRRTGSENRWGIGGRGCVWCPDG